MRNTIRIEHKQRNVRLDGQYKAIKDFLTNEGNWRLIVISNSDADYLGEYKIRFFSDGVERLIDFSEFLNNAKNPMAKKIT